MYLIKDMIEVNVNNVRFNFLQIRYFLSTAGVFSVFRCKKKLVAINFTLNR